MIGRTHYCGEVTEQAVGEKVHIKRLGTKTP